MTQHSERHSLLDTAVVSGLGMLVVHELAYAPDAIASAAVSHAHLPVLWAVLGPLALLVVGLYVVSSLRSRPGSRRLDPGKLCLSVATMFTALELFERGVNGLKAASLFGEPVYWLALALSPLVCVALSRLVNTVVDVLVEWIAVPEAPLFVLLPSPALPSITVAATIRVGRVRPESPRGPPNRIV